MCFFSCIRTRRGVALLLLACLLFTQAALAAAACVSPSASAPDAFAPASLPCHDAPPANLCLAQCTAADQSSGPASTALAPPPLAAVLEVVSVSSEPAPAVHRHDAALVRALGPPPFRRLCSLLL